MEHKDLEAAFADLHPFSVISELGHMIVPQCIAGQADWEEDGGLLMYSREETTQWGHWAGFLWLSVENPH